MTSAAHYRRNNWTRLSHIYPWSVTIERIINSLRIPPLDGPTIYVASDYGGAHKESEFETYSVLYLDIQASNAWELSRRYFRENYLPNSRRMSFKKLGDKHRQDALAPFLDAANNISGILVTLAVRKSITSLCSDEAFFSDVKTQLDLAQELKFESFERMLRIVNLVSMLCGGLAKNGQNLYWISDQDDMFANQKITMDTKKLLDRYSSFYVSKTLGEVGVGTTAIDEGDNLDEDLNSITDLVAGSIAEIVTSLAVDCGGYFPVNVAIPQVNSFTSKTELIYSWINDNNYALQRVVIVAEKRPERSFAVFRLNSN